MSPAYECRKTDSEKAYKVGMTGQAHLTPSTSKPPKKSAADSNLVGGKIKKRAGRKPGTPNKVTKALKDMILGALNDAGGQKYLAEQAKENPGPFMALVGKVLPTTLAGDPSSPIVVQLVQFDGD